MCVWERGIGKRKGEDYFLVEFRYLMEDSFVC